VTPVDSPSEPKPSGLANPQRAARSLGAAAMTLEGITLLLAIQPIRMLADRASGHLAQAPPGRGDTTGAVIFLVVVAVAAFVLAGMMRRAWAWHAAGALQIVLILGFVAHWSIAVIGVVFGLAWLYVLKVRRTILS
jgi:Protein of unknown function (DUF4233)